MGTVYQMVMKCSGEERYLVIIRLEGFTVTRNRKISSDDKSHLIGTEV
jgi:hypothetical protein